MNRLHAQLLQTPKLLVGVEDNSLDLLGEVLEPDLTSHPFVRRQSAPQSTAPVRSWIPAHGKIGILDWLLEVEEASEYGCVASGGHAAVGVASKVVGNALRQQPVASIPQGHPNIVHRLRPRVAAACYFLLPHLGRR